MNQQKAIAWAFVTCSALLVLLVAMLPTASGQSMTGQISGTVLDPQSAVIPGAAVTLTNELTGQEREMASGSQGEFLFTQLLAGTYAVRVSASGFKVFEQKGIKLSANEKMALSSVKLEIGTTSETVEVTADVARVETATSERTGLISSTQVSELAASADRDFMKLLRVVPGVTFNADIPLNNAGGPPPPGPTYQVLGGKSGQTIVSLDGIADTDTSANWNGQTFTNPNVDAISEMKVMLTNYTAEYGIRSGGTINVSIKNGTREFHGSAYEFKRHEKLNANEWDNNRQGTSKQRYRYDNFGYTLGGPVIIPGTGFNQNREKLFFFVAMEWMKNVTPSGIQRRRFPTEKERQGDFSETVQNTPDLSTPIVFRDPSTGQPFSDGGVLNKIPASRADAVGKAFLNFYPQPNHALDIVSGSQYNWVGDWLTERPRNQQIYRIDWNVAPKTLVYSRFVRTSSPTTNPMGGETIEANYPVLGTYATNLGLNFVATWIQTFSTSLVNEVTAGFNRGSQNQTPFADQLAKVQRTNIVGLENFKQFYPSLNPMNIMPSAMFSAGGGGPGGPPPGGGGGGGAPSVPNLYVRERFLVHGNNTIVNISDNLSYVRGAHNLKFGFYSELTSKNGTRESTFAGALYFNSVPTNPLDTNFPMANAFIGSVTQYQESDKRQWSQARYKNIEFYAQDSWRATRRLTIDIGARFQNIAPTRFEDGKMSIFIPGLYDANKAMKYIEPTMGPTGPAGLNPITGEIVPSVYVGTFAMPAGGLTVDQMYPAVQIFDETYLNNPGFNISPRFGFAYDVFGNGKMAVRGGFGMFFERSGGDEFQSNYLMSPPIQNLLTIYNTTIPQIQAATLTYGPASGVYGVRSGQRDFSEPGSYNWSLGIQRDVGFGFVLDVSYVGTVGRHMRRMKAINALQYGTNFLPTSRWPSGMTKDANFLRPYQGYSAINYILFDDSSNYHSLQMVLNRRFGTRLTVQGNWVWSKTMDYGTQYEGPFTGGNPDFMPDRLFYGRADSDRTHNVMVNFTYKLPDLSSRLGNNIIAKGIFDGWQLSGIGSMISGQMMGVRAGISGGPPVDMTGGESGPGGLPTRANIVGNPILSNPTGMQSRLNGAAIALPTYGDPNFGGSCQYGDPFTCGFGNAPRDVFRGPGANNWDISLFKNFQLGSNEERSLQFRWETYNTFNHTQYTGVSTNASFDYFTGAQTNASLGQFTSAGPARKMVLALKLKF